MRKRWNLLITLIAVLGFAALYVPQALAGEMMVVSARNPCSANPCAMKNPCSMRNPCSSNPCSMKNPCAGKNPCAAAGIVPLRGKAIKGKRDLNRLGKKLWNDTSLGKSGLACNTCHPGGMGLKKTPYPKYIKMPNDIVTLDQMINFCMLNPMKGKALPWNSREMTALAAYVTANMKGGKPAMNPCSMKNPCAGKNPCSMKNPCSRK